MKDEMKIGSNDDRDLRQRTKEFALRVVRMFSALPKSTEAQVLGKQVLRSGTSVGANYRFELLEETGVATPASLEPLKKECNELLAIFTTIAKKCKAEG